MAEIDKKTQTCDECRSTYFEQVSKMKGLCPECAYQLYECENCEHFFQKGRCIHCYWDGSVSEFILKRS